MVRKGEERSNRAIKIRLYPTDKQKAMINKNFNSAIKAYNFGVAALNKGYEDWRPVYLDLKSKLPSDMPEEEQKKFIGKEKGKYVPFVSDIRKQFTVLANQADSEYHWMKQKDVDSSSYQYVFQDLDRALDKFNQPGNYDKMVNKHKEATKKALQKGKEPKTYKYPYDFGFPQFKSCKDTEKSYPTRIPRNKINTKNSKVYLPCIGWVRYSSNQEIPNFVYPSVNVANPRVSTDGRNYFLSFGYYIPNQELNISQSEVLGVDLGLKELAVLSDNTIFKNMAKDKKVIKLNKKIKKLQRKYNWLQDHAEPMWKLKQELGEDKWKKEKWKHSTKQMRKIAKLKRKTQIKINNIKSHNMKVYADNICKRNPKCIVVENLNIEGMKKNKKISSSVHQAAMYTFKSILCSTAKKYNITVKEVDRFYPSSQDCSSCGERNKQMKDLSKRTFVCPHCGYTQDRDVNAAINLSKMANNPSLKIIV